MTFTNPEWSVKGTICHNCKERSTLFPKDASLIASRQNVDCFSSLNISPRNEVLFIWPLILLMERIVLEVNMSLVICDAMFANGQSSGRVNGIHASLGFELRYVSKVESGVISWSESA